MLTNSNRSNCIFCRIIAQQSPARIVYQDEQAVAFHDIHPQAPVHILIVPRKHISKLQDLEAEDENMAGHLLYVAKLLADKENLSPQGYRLVINNGRYGGQAIFHLHLHLLGGRPLQWPPG